MDEYALNYAAASDLPLGLGLIGSVRIKLQRGHVSVVMVETMAE